MPRLTRRRAVAGLLAVGLAAGTVLLWPSSAPPPLPLAGGARLTLRAVEAGRTASHYYGSWLTRLTRTLPVAVANHLPQGRDFLYTYDSTNLVFWMQVDRLPVPVKQPRLRFVLESAADVESQREATTSARSREMANLLPMPSTQALPGGREFGVCLATDRWPRSSPHLVLKVFDEDLASTTRLAGQWQIPNPAITPRASWAGSVSSLPAVQQIDQIRFTLEQFELRPMPSMIWSLSGTNVLEPMAYLRLRATNLAGTGGPPWDLMAVRWTDAEGNRAAWRNRFRPWPGSNVWQVSGVKLPSSRAVAYQIETAWHSHAPFGPDERTVVPLNQPTTGAMSSVSVTNNAGEHRFTVVGFKRPTQGWRVGVAQPDPGQDKIPPYIGLLEIRETQGQGRRWPDTGSGGVELPSDATNVLVTVGVRPIGKTVTFIVAPTRRATSLPTADP